MARLAVAEQLVADRSKQAATLAATLALVTGAAAAVVADQLNALNGQMESVTAERDAIAAELAAQQAPARKRVRRVSPATVVAQAVEAAGRAGWEAQRAWQKRDWANSPDP